MELQQEFEYIKSVIRSGRNQALQAAYQLQLRVYWQVGGFIEYQLAQSNWGEKVVDNLAIWLKEEDPLIKGFDRRSIYRMLEFYRCYSSLDLQLLGIVGVSNPQLQKADLQLISVVGVITPQLVQLPFFLAKISWSHHIEILKRTKSSEERLFYLLLATKENYTVKELIRQIQSSLYERQKGSSQYLINHPAGAQVSRVFRDKYLFDFLDLPEIFSERDLQKGLVKNLKSFLLELGRDFLFVSEEFRIQVGMSDFFIDLLFYHRELRCLVVFELKIDEFKPEYLGKLNFYLEAMDRDVKKEYENPTIGVLLCAKKDKEVVEYALSRSSSQSLVAEFQTKMPSKGLLQKLLHQWAKELE